MSAFAQVSSFKTFADRYRDIRRANPDINAGEVVTYLQAIDSDPVHVDDSVDLAAIVAVTA